MRAVILTGSSVSFRLIWRFFLPPPSPIKCLSLRPTCANCNKKYHFPNLDSIVVIIYLTSYYWLPYAAGSHTGSFVSMTIFHRTKPSPTPNQMSLFTPGLRNATKKLSAQSRKATRSLVSRFWVASMTNGRLSCPIYTDCDFILSAKL
jgi:hypothetical protein